MWIAVDEAARRHRPLHFNLQLAVNNTYSIHNSNQTNDADGYHVTHFKLFSSHSFVCGLWVRAIDVTYGRWCVQEQFMWNAYHLLGWRQAFKDSCLVTMQLLIEINCPISFRLYYYYVLCRFEGWSRQESAKMGWDGMNAILQRLSFILLLLSMAFKRCPYRDHFMLKRSVWI